MFEEAAIARRDSHPPPMIVIHERRDSTSTHSPLVRDFHFHSSFSTTTKFSFHFQRTNFFRSFLRFQSTSMDQNQQRTMSTTEIDLESVLQVRRRRLSVTAPQASQDAHRYTDVIFLKVEKSNDILKEDARCIFHGKLFRFGFYFVFSVNFDDFLQAIITSSPTFFKNTRHTLKFIMMIRKP